MKIVVFMGITLGIIISSFSQLNPDYAIGRGELYQSYGLQSIVKILVRIF